MDENILEDSHEYEEAWVRTMLEIWKEKIERLRVIRTGALHQSFDQQIQQSQRGDSLKMRFLRYGTRHWLRLCVGRGRQYRRS